MTEEKYISRIVIPNEMINISEDGIVTIATKNNEEVVFNALENNEEEMIYPQVEGITPKVI